MVLEKLEAAIRESVIAKPHLAEFAVTLIGSSIRAVYYGEEKVKRIKKENSAQAAFVGLGREKLYAQLFIVKGVSQKTADELVSELIAA